MPPPLSRKAMTTQASVTLNRKTLASKATDVPVPWIRVGDDSQDECCSAGQNGQNGARVLRDEKGSCAREHQRHVGDGQLQRAVIMFDRRCGGDGGGHQAGQQHRPFEIAHDERDRGRAEEQRRDREWQVLGAAFGQQDDTDCRQQYQGQDHADMVAGDGRNTMSGSRRAKSTRRPHRTPLTDVLEGRAVEHFDDDSAPLLPGAWRP